MGDLRDEWEAANPGSVADTAIPLGWAERVQQETGEYPFGFIWGYLPKSIFGNPVPVTESAKKLFASLPKSLR
jgi:hypothetical protein